MLKIAIATIVSAVIMVLGYQQGTFIWVGAALLCIVLETALFNNIMFFIPAVVGGSGAFGQFFMGDAKTAVMLSVVVGMATIVLLFKELTHDKEAEKLAKQANLKKVRGHQY